MASSCHWVDELFPPRFNFTTPFDSDKVQYETDYTRKIKNVQKIYQDVYLATKSPNKDKQELDTSLNSLQPTKSLESVIEEKSALCDKIKAESEQNVNNVTERECIWSKDELKVLRKSSKRSKLNNIRLSVLAHSLQKDCEHLRNMCQEQAREILKCNRKYNEVRKQNKRMKITCRAFKEDTKKYNVDFEECQGLLEVAVSTRESSEVKLLHTEKELEVTQKKLEIFKSEVEKQKMMQNRMLKNQKTALELIHAKEVYRLTAKLEETQLRLEKEQNDHTINKKALEHLRLHFASGKK